MWHKSRGRWCGVCCSRWANLASNDFSTCSCHQHQHQHHQHHHHHTNIIYWRLMTFFTCPFHQQHFIFYFIHSTLSTWLFDLSISPTPFCFSIIIQHHQHDVSTCPFHHHQHHLIFYISSFNTINMTFPPVHATTTNSILFHWFNTINMTFQPVHATTKNTNINTIPTPSTPSTSAHQYHSNLRPTAIQPVHSTNTNTNTNVYTNTNPDILSTQMNPTSWIKSFPAQMKLGR